MDWISFLFGVTLGASIILTTLACWFAWLVRPFLKAARDAKQAGKNVDAPIVWPEAFNPTNPDPFGSTTGGNEP